MAPALKSRIKNVFDKYPLDKVESSVNNMTNMLREVGEVMFEVFTKGFDKKLYKSNAEIKEYIAWIGRNYQMLALTNNFLINVSYYDCMCFNRINQIKKEISSFGTKYNAAIKECKVAGIDNLKDAFDHGIIHYFLFLYDKNQTITIKQEQMQYIYALNDR